MNVYLPAGAVTSQLQRDGRRGRSGLADDTLGSPHTDAPLKLLSGGSYCSPYDIDIFSHLPNFETV